MGIEDYIGRTVDILAYQGATSSGKTLLTQSLVTEDSSGQITTGAQKLAQRMLLELLTETGTIPYLPDRGCEFMVEARQGVWRSPLDIQSAFSAAMTDVENNLKIEESANDPADERFESAELKAVTLTAGEASITIQVNSLAGRSREIILPLELLI
jgi:hypothetical protein